MLDGPPFLQLSQEDWPSIKKFENYKYNESHCLAELSNSDIDTDMKNVFSFEKYNSFEKLIRITSFVLRFIDNIKLKVENKTLEIGNLTLDKINRAKRLLIKNEQKGFLSSNEIKAKLANNLGVFLDKNGLLRVKGRLQKSLLLYETKFPILVNKNSLLGDSRNCMPPIRVPFSAKRTATQILVIEKLNGRKDFILRVSVCDIIHRSKGITCSKLVT